MKAAGTGVAVLTMPRLLTGCTRRGQVAPEAAQVTAALPADPFVTWFGVDDAMLRGALGELTQRGADRAELYFQYGRTHSIEMEDGIVNKASAAIDEGVGLRAVIGDQVGYAFTEDISIEAMRDAARTARAIAHGGQVTAPPQSFELAQSGNTYYVTEVPWSEVGIDQKLPKLRALEKMARSLDPAVERVRIRWSDGEDRILVADARGRLYTDLRPMTRLWCEVTARKGGVVQSNSANLSARQSIDWYTDEQLQMLAAQAVDRTMRLFDARRPPAGEWPVVLDAGASGILLHEAIGHGMEADFNRKGVSIYSDMLGRKVAPDFVTMVDSGVEPNERGALNVDDEGEDCERTVLVENGILKSYLHDSISARHYGVKSTGSGRRESFRHMPMPRMRCTYMENGPHARDEIIASVKKGIIAETFTNGQVEIGAGDFTFYIKNGWLVEDGKITAPIKDCNIIGNGPRALRNVSMAANDARMDTGGWTCGKNGQGVPVSIGLPTVLVSSMTVGGVNA